MLCLLILSSSRSISIFALIIEFLDVPLAASFIFSPTATFTSPQKLSRIMITSALLPYVIKSPASISWPMAVSNSSLYVFSILYSFSLNSNAFASNSFLPADIAFSISARSFAISSFIASKLLCMLRRSSSSIMCGTLFPSCSLYLFMTCLISPARAISFESPPEKITASPRMLISLMFLVSPARPVTAEPYLLAALSIGL